MQGSISRVGIFLLSLLLGIFAAGCSDAEPEYDVILRGGTIFDGSGSEPIQGDVAIAGRQIAYIGPHADGRARSELDVRGLAVAPGFVNLLSWAGEPLLVDGRAQSDLRQGVTTEVMGEGVSLGPLTPAVRDEYRARQTHLRYEMPWTTLGQALEHLVEQRVAVNVASYVGAATIRMNVLGSDNVEPSHDELREMRTLVAQAMEEGSLGVASSLIYTPGAYAGTDELVALAEEAGRCGGIYATHMRSETDRFLEAVDEAIEIGKRSGAPVEIFHLKAGGRDNWHKLEGAIERINAARDEGLRVTTDMYAYAASSTGLDASMPDWVQEGGVSAWIERLQEPVVRARVIADMRSENPDWDNVRRAAGGGQGVLLVGFRDPEMNRYIGKTVADVARERGVSEEDVIIDLVVEDGSRVTAIYFTMSEENLETKVRLPYMSIASDGRAVSAEGDFLRLSEHPRSYGNFARVLGEFVRERQLLPLTEAVHRMSGLPASVLSLRDRGFLRPGYAADVVVFDPQTISDHATFEDPHRYATGVHHVFVNGSSALLNGELTGALPGQVVRGRAWTGWPEGGCRTTAEDWAQ